MRSLCSTAGPSVTRPDSWVQNSGLRGVFDPHLSADRVQVFKLDPRAYQMAQTAFGVPRTQLAFSAHAGWGATGASAYGYRTFWVNRTNAPAEGLTAAPVPTSQPW